MQIIETFLCGKENNPKTCEDGIFCGKYMVAVIDGVTAKGQMLWDGHKSGFYAKELLLAYFAQTGIEKQNAQELFANLDDYLYKHAVAKYPQLPAEEYPRASVIVYNDIYKEIWSYGDCQCRINDIVYNHAKKIDQLNSMLRSYYLEYHLENGMTLQELQEHDLGRTAIEESLRMQFSFENKAGEFGYPVLNGMGIAPHMISVHKVCAGDEIILASDGYPKLEACLEKSEESLKKIMETDPMCFRRYPCTKGIKAGNVSFDDRAFCRIITSKKVLDMVKF